MRFNFSQSLYFILMVALANIASAGIIVSVNVTPNSSTGMFAPGDTVVADVFLQLTAPADRLGIYSFGVQYDTSELTYVSRQDFPFGVLSERFPNSPTEPLGTITNINAYNLSSPPQDQTGIFGPVRVASLVFTATNPTGDATDIDLLPGAFDIGNDLFGDGLGNLLTSSVTFNGASVTAVPEPSSMVALASVAGVGAYLRRRQKNKVAKPQQV